MVPSDKPEFGKLLGNVMASYGKPLPDAPMVAVWFNVLTPFAPKVIAAAFAAYSTERPDHAPVPNSIAGRCRLMDGRPDENEAWAIALTTRGEQETVVWTEEARDAFGACQPVLATGDEIGARMAFKDAYGRLVTAARAANRPAVWFVSEGWDKTKKALVIASAQRAGLLPAPPEHMALEFNGGASQAEPAGRPEGLRRVLEAVAQLDDPLEKAERHRLARIEAEREADERRKAEIAQQVAQYQERP